MYPYYEIQPSDVGRIYLKAFGKMWSIAHFIGQILPGDVGKRVYRQQDSAGLFFLQVENDQQRAARLSKGA